MGWPTQADTPMGDLEELKDVTEAVATRGQHAGEILFLWDALVEVLVAESCVLSHFSPTLCTLMDGCLPGSSVHEILQARILEWVSMPSCSGSS